MLGIQVYRESLSRRVLFLAAFAFAGSILSPGISLAQKIDPVKEYIRWQEQLRTATMTVECDYTAVDSTRPKTNQQQFFVHVRRDGNRVDWDCMVSKGRSRHWARTITSGDKQYLYYRTPTNQRRAKDGVWGPDHGDVQSDVIAGGALDGYFVGSDGLSLAEILKLPGSKVQVGALVMIGGEPCQHVLATTPYGRIQMWLAKNQSYVPLQVIYEKESTDRWQDNASVQNSKFHDGVTAMKSWRATLTDVVLSKVGDTFVPARGKLVMKWLLAEDRTYSQEGFYERQDIDLNPDFSKDPDAFVFDLEDGLPIRNDFPSAKGKYYIWKDGRVEEGIPESNIAKSSSKWPGQSEEEGWGWLEYGGIAIGVLAVGSVAGFLFRKMKLQK